jgi:hypothetical protein
MIALFCGKANHQTDLAVSVNVACKSKREPPRLSRKRHLSRNWRHMPKPAKPSAEGRRQKTGRFTLPHFAVSPLGRRITTALEILHMLAVSGECWRAAAALQDMQHGVDFSLAKYRLLE